MPKIKEYNKIKFKIKNDYLISDINNENMCFAYTLSKILKIKEKIFINAMRSFKGLSHRFETFLNKKNIIFINDSKATSFRATETALSSLKNIYWILGGLPKKGDKIRLSKFKRNIIKCYIIGKNVNFFKHQLRDKLYFAETKTLKNTIIKVLQDIKPDKNKNQYILFSPAAASFDQFSNFENRGNEFKRLCRKYARKFI